MSKFRKNNITVYCFRNVFGIIPITSASKLPADVIGTKFEESVELLQALDIMVGDKDTGDFRLNDDIKRSEVAKNCRTFVRTGRRSGKLGRIYEVSRRCCGSLGIGLY